LKIITGDMKCSENRGLFLGKSFRILLYFSELIVHKSGNSLDALGILLAPYEILLIQDLDFHGLFQVFSPEPYSSICSIFSNRETILCFALSLADRKFSN
jgi:hypothetical protein